MVGACEHSALARCGLVGVQCMSVCSAEHCTHVHEQSIARSKHVYCLSTGARVVIFGRRAAVLEAACELLRTDGVECAHVAGDVRSEEDCHRAVDATVARFGRLTVLVNGAAGNFLSAAESLTGKGFRTVLDIDAVGTFTMSRAAFPRLREAGGALIVNVTATLHYGASWYQVHAAAAKAAVDATTRSLALEWGEYGIRVVGLAPGPIGGTPGMAKLGGGAADELLAQVVPLGRLGTPFDVAMMAVFLATRAAAFVSGDTIVVDGAHWLWRPAPLSRDAVRSFARSAESSSRELVPRARL